MTAEARFVGMTDAEWDYWLTVSQGRARAFEAVRRALNDVECSYSRSYFAPGELEDSAVVITVGRVSRDDYERLASGAADYRAEVVEEVTA